MSEQAKIAYIQEELKEAKGNQRHGSILVIVGAILTGAGFALADVSQSALYLGILGVLLVVSGIVYGAYYVAKVTKLKEQLKTMAIKIVICPKCGKEIPEGNYTFCPFCGSPLAPPP